jgi:hypothetical protein
MQPLFKGIVPALLILVLTKPVYSGAYPKKGIEEVSITLYTSIDFGDADKPDFELFYKGLTGYFNLKESKNLASDKEILTLIDFRKSGNEKRLWVIDIKNKRVLFHSLVAHGRNSGEVYPSKFSNVASSYQSSLGFYVTGNTYIGKHGISLKLHGVEQGINHLAEPRAIVMHGADYVSEEYIKKVGRLGRSYGCPAVPMDIHKEIVKELAGGTVLFIYYPDKDYMVKSKLLAAPEQLLVQSLFQQ